MSEHLRALAVILVLATLVFTFAKGPAIAMATVSGEFERRRNLWFCITLAAFLSHNFWLFVVIAGVLLYRTAAKDKEPIGLAIFVLFAIPLVSLEIPGFAGVRYLFRLNYFLLLSLVVFVPLFIREVKNNSFKHFASESTDRFLYAYLILGVLLRFIASDGEDITGLLRNSFLACIGTLIPYAVASRMIKDDASLRSAVSAYVVGASVMAAVGIVEAAKYWLLYTSLSGALGADFGIGIYLRRGDSLRAFATGGQAIIYGYMMAVGLILMLGLKRYFTKKWLWWCGLALLLMGLLASYSRGPWLATAVGVLVFLLSGPKRWVSISQLLIVGALIAVLLLATPLGDKVYNALTIQSENYDYRVRVFEVSSRVILQNPFFGPKDADALSDLEELRQGQGIIDIVNAYVGVALSSGFVGLFLFVGFFVSAIVGICKRLSSTQDKSSESVDLGRALLATLICILVSIYSVSTISYIAIIYHLMVALSVAYARIAKFPANDKMENVSALQGNQSKMRGRGRTKRLGRYASRTV